ncbi:hypothetical protein ACWCYZ_00850 [Streptomyces virginiae]|uniref:hypothetical protein n=1 Tax=Streptomyces TaxID=1883 RepID=UPI000F3AA7FC|nr:hypothetical protein [Streptomyces sp. ADI95-16]AYV29652.1 hypothetical protein EES41_23330 [Streptomyces sp. ADI95-16]
MGRPSILPPPSELFKGLATGRFRNQAEIAREYGVSKAAVTLALAPYKEDKIDYRAFMPWEFAVPGDASNHRAARALRLHFRAQLQPETLSEKDATAHTQWLASLVDRTLAYSPEERWHYVPRTADHGGLVAVLPSGVDLPAETVTLYRLGEPG